MNEPILFQIKRQDGTFIDVTGTVAYKMVKGFVHRAVKRGYFHLKIRGGRKIARQIHNNGRWEIDDLIHYILVGNGGDFIDTGFYGDNWDFVPPRYETSLSTERKNPNRVHKEGINKWRIKKGWLESEGKVSMSKLLHYALMKYNAGSGYWQVKYYEFSPANQRWTRINKKDFSPTNPNQMEMRIYPRRLEDVSPDSDAPDFRAKMLEFTKGFMGEFDDRDQEIMRHHIEGYNYQQIGEMMEIHPKQIERTIHRIKSDVREMQAA